MLLLFLFFVATSMTSSGVQSFSIAALTQTQALLLAGAGSALTGYLFASAIGVLAGGVLADRNQRHDLVALTAFGLTALVMVTLGKAFGFLSTGISLGGALVPVLFGWLIDQGRADGVFYLIAGFMALGMIAVAAGSRQRSLAGDEDDQS